MPLQNQVAPGTVTDVKGPGAVGVDALEEEAFDAHLAKKMELVEMNPAFLSRPVNDGFSGGEKKRNEIL